VTHVRLDVFPDGGLARLRVHGELLADAHRAAVLRWLDLLPRDHAIRILVTDAGLPSEVAADLISRRPFTGTTTFPPEALRSLLP
jgi:allantoicase